MYWVILSLFHLVESYFSFITAWIPFFAWLRLFAHLYLILPGMQGATFLYLTYLEPAIARHESEIEDFIAQTHERARRVGLLYVKNVIEWVRLHVLGQVLGKADGVYAAQARQQQQQQQQQRGQLGLGQQAERAQGYTQSLLSRFNLPAPVAAAGSSESYSVLASALQGVMAGVSIVGGGGGGGGGGAGGSAGTSREAQVESLSSSGMLVPPELDTDERLSFIAAQKERLGILMRALDREAEAGQPQSGSAGKEGAGKEDAGKEDAGMRKSKSEMEFDTIDRDEAGGKVVRAGQGASAGGSWMPWSWGAKGEAVSADRKKQ